MKKYEAVFLLDMSGSMTPVRELTINAFNSMLQSQRMTEKQVRVTTVLFNSEVNVL